MGAYGEHNSLRMLAPGDRVWIKIPGEGFVGVGRVFGSRVAAKDYLIEERPAVDVLTANYHREFVADAERCEYFVTAEWLQTRPILQAVQEVGMFRNQNTVCRPVTPKWRSTVDRLKELFGVR